MFNDEHHKRVREMYRSSEVKCLWTWEENKSCAGEYVIYYNDEVFCHMSNEMDFMVFRTLLNKAQVGPFLRRI